MRGAHQILGLLRRDNLRCDHTNGAHIQNLQYGLGCKMRYPHQHRKIQSPSKRQTGVSACAVKGAMLHIDANEIEMRRGQYLNQFIGGRFQKRPSHHFTICHPGFKILDAHKFSNSSHSRSRA